ncbi:aldehyde dehydrogenase family protein [Pseudonocardia xishanensis]|uniref:Aldehyde dehydrogenase n=1 Tax=Pseudonocardia xishanensis TaxID=630995 RepID=A0ABP8RE50_9PSEU
MTDSTRPDLQDRYGLFIDGTWTPGSDRVLPAVDPSTGQTFSTIADASAADVGAAVAAAAKAFGRWGTSPWGKRAATLEAIADRIAEHAAHLAAVESLDAGKPIRQSRTWDLPVAVESFRYFAAAARTQRNDLTAPARAALNLEIREPLGPVAQIIPWNGSVLMLGWKLAPALAAGCTVVVKPSEQASVAALETVRLIADLLPPGVVNIVTGGAEAGQALTSHPDIARISFTGSGAVGKQVMAAAADTITPVTLELGGKSPTIVLPDADLDAAVGGAVTSIVPNQGQMCVAGSRLLLHEDVAEPFLAKLTERLGTLRFGPALDENTDMGPLISAAHAERVDGFRKRALEAGGRAIVAVEPSAALREGGGFFGALAAIEVPTDAELARHEVFGPLLAVARWSDESELLDIAASTGFALGAGVWGSDLNTIMRLVRSLRSGTVWVNDFGSLPAGSAFGGVDASGFGRDNALETMRDYQYSKSVVFNLRGKPLPLY